MTVLTSLFFLRMTLFLSTHVAININDGLCSRWIHERALVEIIPSNKSPVIHAINAMGTSMIDDTTSMNYCIPSHWRDTRVMNHGIIYLFMHKMLGNSL